MVEEQAGVPEDGDAVEGNADPTEEAWRDAIEEHCDRFLGPCPNVIAETSSDLVRIDLDPYLPAHNRERTTVVTVGVSTKGTSAPDAMASYRHIELFTYLPSNWSYGTDEPHWWPCRMLKDVGRLVHRLETWYAPGQLLGGDPDEPLTDESLLTGVVLLPPVYEDPAFDQLEIDGKNCHFLWAFPLTTPEIEFAQDKGVSKLLELMAERDVQLPLDNRRACMITGRKYGEPESASGASPASTAQHSSHPSQPVEAPRPSQPPAPDASQQHHSQPPPPRHQSQPQRPPQQPPARPAAQRPPAAQPPQGPYGGPPAPQQRPPQSYPAQHGRSGPQQPYGPPRHGGGYGPGYGPQQPYAPPQPQPPQQYGPPRPQQYGPPQQGGYGPPQQYGPPRPQQGPPQQYRPPGPQYGPPGQAPYGPPQQYGPRAQPPGPGRSPQQPGPQGPPQQQHSPELWNKILVGIEQRLNRLLQTDGFLVIEEAASGYYVMLASSRQRGTLVCEAVSNQFLPTGRRLSSEQEQRMRSLGWSPPGQGEASGTWNHARTLHVPIKMAGVARVAVTTLRDIYSCDPRKLSYTGNPTAVADINEPFNPS